MTQFSQDIQATAQELITEFGSSVSVTRYDNVINPVTGAPYGNATGILVNSSTYPIGSDEITLSASGEGEILAGDKITFAGHATEYTIDTGLSDISAGGTITLTTTLTAEVAAGEAITLTDKSTVSTYTATIVTDSFSNFDVALSLLAAASGNSLIQGTDKKVYIAYSATYTPEVGDNLVYKSKTYRIADIKTYDLQTDTYLYEVRLEI